MCLLLIACSNVATLRLHAASHSRRKMALRTALGAPKSRIVRHFSPAVSAGVLGLIAAWTSRLRGPGSETVIAGNRGQRDGSCVRGQASFSRRVSPARTSLRSARADGAGVTRLDGRGVTRARSQSRRSVFESRRKPANANVLLVGAGLIAGVAFHASTSYGSTPSTCDDDYFAAGTNSTLIITSRVMSHEAVQSRRCGRRARCSNGGGKLLRRRGTARRVRPANDSQEPTFNTRVLSPSILATLQIPIGRPSVRIKRCGGTAGGPRSIMVSEVR